MLALGRLLELTLAGREPAEKIQLREGTRFRWLGEGALEVTPPVERDCGLDLLLSAGIHGNETAPIELLDEVLHALADGRLKPRARILIVFGNPAAMRRGKRFIEQDLNRLFNGRHELSEGYEALRASELERLVANFFQDSGRERLHYDLHTALRGSRIEQFALYPFQSGRAHSRRQLARLAAAGVQAVLRQNKTSNTFTAFTYEKLGAEAFTLELGKARPFGHNAEVDLTRLARRLRLIIEHLEDEQSEPDLSGLQLFDVSREVIKHSDEFRLHLDDDVENFTELPKGFLLAEDLAGTRWVIEEQGARIVFPNPKVRNGLRAGILVIPAGKPELA